jgi:hypothetical protein
MGHVGGRGQGSTVASWVRLVKCSARVAGEPDCGCRRRVEEKADLFDEFVSIIYGFAAHLYGLRRR